MSLVHIGNVREVYFSRNHRSNSDARGAWAGMALQINTTCLWCTTRRRMSRRKWPGSRPTPDPWGPVKNIPILNVYYLLCYVRGRVQERDTARLATLGGLSTVQDLLGKVLAGGVNHLFRRGIDRGYVERREDLAGIRGKLAVSETAKRALRARARAACEFEELSVDILPNRILRSSLHGLLGRRVTLDRHVRADVRSAYRRLDGISRTRLKRNTFG